MSSIRFISSARIILLPTVTTTDTEELEVLSGFYKFPKTIINEVGKITFPMKVKNFEKKIKSVIA